MQGEQLEKWKLIFETKNWTIEYTRRMADSDLCVDLQYAMISQAQLDGSEPERFPWLFKAEEGFKINVNRCERNVAVYKNIDMFVEVTINKLHVHWKPKSINRMLRFIRFMKFHVYQYKTWLRQILFRYK